MIQWKQHKIYIFLLLMNLLYIIGFWLISSNFN